MYYYKTRNYAPMLDRFMQTDPIGRKMVSKLNELLNALSIIAGNPEDQIKYLAEIGLINDIDHVNENANIDEIALQFEDTKYIINAIEENNGFDIHTLNLISRLDELLNKLSGSDHSDFWTIRALKYDVRWKKVRDLARQCLLQIQK